jgi:hypothetical protein
MNDIRRFPTSQAAGRRRAAVVCAALLALSLEPVPAAETSPARQLQRWSVEAGSPGEASRGGTFFTSRHGGDWSCASCHGSRPTVAGRHASTGKSIDPLAPAANPRAFTDSAKVDKWFRRNCNDVLRRECSATEKADLLAWLSSLQP